MVLLLFASGFAGLVYEVVWLRLAMAAFGVTTPLVSIVLAVFMAVLAMLYTRTFYGITHLFHHSHIPAVLRPALGAFASGAIGFGPLRLDFELSPLPLAT